MRWTVNYTKETYNFIIKNNVKELIKNEILKLMFFLEGEETNLDIKKLKGEWKGYFRIRKGKLRIILMIEKVNNDIIIDKVDFRGGVYN